MRTLMPSIVASLALGAGVDLLAATKIVGTIKDTAGNPVAGVEIKLTASDPGQPLQHAKTNKKKGQFFFAMVREGTYRLEAFADGWRVASVDLRALDPAGKKSFEFASPIEPGAAMPEFSVGENDSATYDIVVTPSPGGAGAHGTGTPVLGTDEIVVLVQKGEVDRARSEIQHALEAHPSDAKMHYLLAFLETQLGRFVEARKAVDNAVGADPAFPGVHLLRGTILRASGDPNGALAEFQLEAAQATDAQLRRDAYIQIAETCRELGRLDEQQHALAKIIELDPQSSAAFTQLLEFHIRASRLDEARALLASAPPDVRNDPNVHFNVAAAYWNAGHIEQAAAAFGKVIELDSSMAEAHRQLGYALMNLGRKQEAAKALSRYLELAPNAPDVSELKGMIQQLSK